jgi:ThiF family/Prokaryotic E2 family B
LSDAALNELLAACLGELKKLPGVHSCATSADGLALAAEFTGTYPWTLEIRVDAQRVNLPEVYALNADCPLAHVSHQRKVCISDEQGVSLDAENYPAVVADAATMALGVLNDAMAGAQAGDHTALFDEFEGYWQGLPNQQVAGIALEINDAPRLVQVSVENAGKRRRPMAYRELGPNARLWPGTAQFVHQRAAYLPLSTALLPPAPGAVLGAASANQYLQALTADGKAVLANLTSAKRDAVFVHLLFSQPRSEGLRAVFGLSLWLKGNRAVPEMRVTPVSLMRCDPAYVRARGGAQESMAAKRVAVLGCGSLGSEIADALASCGVGNLAVVDPDVLTWDNVFRHALGADAVGKYKADALAARLQARYPGVQASSHRERAEQWLAASKTEFDAFVIAVGHPTRERALNEQLVEQGKLHAAVTAWIEALGLGGHVVGFRSNASGCLACIYSDAEGMAQLRPRTAFVAEGQRVTRNLTGCVGGFTPYSALHSRRTALLAAEVVLEYLQGKASAAYRFWRGDGRDAEAAKVATTAWFATAATCSQLDAESAAFAVRCGRCRATA